MPLLYPFLSQASSSESLPWNTETENCMGSLFLLYLWTALWLLTSEFVLCSLNTAVRFLKQGTPTPVDNQSWTLKSRHHNTLQEFNSAHTLTACFLSAYLNSPLLVFSISSAVWLYQYSCIYISGLPIHAVSFNLLTSSILNVLSDNY